MQTITETHSAADLTEAYTTAHELLERMKREGLELSTFSIFGNPTEWRISGSFVKDSDQ